MVTEGEAAEGERSGRAGVMAPVPALRAIWAAPTVSGSRPNSLVRMTRTDGAADGDVDDLAKGGRRSGAPNLAVGIFGSHG